VTVDTRTRILKENKVFDVVGGRPPHFAGYSNAGRASDFPTQRRKTVRELG
jgi:hypothetical protein